MSEVAELPGVSEDSSDVAGYDRAAAVEQARSNLNFLAAMAMPEFFTFLFPPLFLALFSLVKKLLQKTRDFSKLAIGIPRGFAKTTVVKLVMLYIILFTDRKFILVVSNVQAHGVNIIKDVIDMLSHTNVRNLFGDWAGNVVRNRQEIKEFHFRGRRIILAAVGAEGNIRGLNVGHARPDVMIFEDFQTKEDSENMELAEKLYQRMLGTIMKAKDPSGCLFMFVANMYPTPGSILQKLKKNSDWISFIVGGILEDGSSLWEELQPIEQLLAEAESDLNAGHPEVFAAEVLNDPEAGLKIKIDLSKIPVPPFSAETELPQGRFILIDPSMGNPTSDYMGILRVDMFDGYGVAAEVNLGKWDPLESIKEAIKMAISSNTNLIIAESGAYQGSLLFWFQFYCDKEQLEGFHFVPITTGGVSKNARIALSIKEIQKASVYLGAQVRSFWVNEILSWDPRRKNNNDTTLDLVAYIPKAIEQYSHLAELREERLVAPPIPLSNVFMTSSF